MNEAARLAEAASSAVDPRVGLRAVVALRRLLDQLERLHVDNARAHGWSWQEIGEVLGLTRQAVHHRFRSGR
jgi:DNA-directed RNA polymerase specialized sigma24 family protein